MIPAGQLTGAVLAGGESRRMGRDKAGLVLDHEPLWQRQARVLREAGAVTVAIVRRPGQPALELPPGIELWQDAVAGAGPLAGLHAALTACPTEFLAVLATDMPRLDAGWFRGLGEHCRDGAGAVACHPGGKFEPLAAIYPVAARHEAGRQLAGADFSLQLLARRLCDQNLLRSVPLPPAEAIRVANWNTPADVASGAPSST